LYCHKKHIIVYLDTLEKFEKIEIAKESICLFQSSLFFVIFSK